MVKMGGTICDNCRTIILYSYDNTLREQWWERKAKKGNLMHFCSLECAHISTPEGRRHELTLHTGGQTEELVHKHE